MGDDDWDIYKICLAAQADRATQQKAQAALHHQAHVVGGEPVYDRTYELDGVWAGENFVVCTGHMARRLREWREVLDVQPA